MLSIVKEKMRFIISKWFLHNLKRAFILQAIVNLMSSIIPISSSIIKKRSLNIFTFTAEAKIIDDLKYQIESYKTQYQLRRQYKKSERLKTPPGMIGREYDQIFPYYMKYCAITKFHPYKGKGIKGSIAGHGLYYLKGVCKDTSLGPAGLKLCDETQSLDEPELGVGLSVNRGLKNVNFVAIPGRSLFLAPALYEHETFSFSVKNRIIAQVLAQQIFHGVHFHEALIPPMTLAEDEEEFIARTMFGSDYAIAMARNLYCINIPTNRLVMAHLVDYFNLLNASHQNAVGTPYRGIIFADIKRDPFYHWHGIYDNCVHPALNALAGLGLLPTKLSNQPLIRQIWNVAVPANTLLDIFKSINQKEIDINKIYHNQLLRQVFLTYHWLPQQAGGLVEAIKLTHPNRVYKHDDTIFMLPSIWKNRKKYLKNIAKTPEFSIQSDGMKEYIPNLLYFKKKYQIAIAQGEQLSMAASFLKYKQLLKETDPSALKLLKTKIEAKITDISLSKKQRFDLENELKDLDHNLMLYQEAKNYTEFIETFINFLKERLAWMDSNIVRLQQS